jgi:opacity protein-like surface antigen
MSVWCVVGASYLAKDSMMRALFAAAITLALAASAANAQDQTPSAQSSPNNSAVKSPNTNISSAPVKGANSFTMGEAKTRIEAHGYTNVSSLKKDTNGVWRGMAQKDGQPVHVSLDFEGNVIGS